MRLGIVGSEGAKFDDRTEPIAREIIREQIQFYTKIVSGGCHLGGIDIWAIEEAKKLGRETEEFLPKTRAWTGYKARNILIAQNSDVVICITVKILPAHYIPRGWERFCYHCQTDTHIKSGGCWTVKYAKSLGKEGRVIVIE